MAGPSLAAALSVLTPSVAGMSGPEVIAALGGSAAAREAFGKATYGLSRAPRRSDYPTDDIYNIDRRHWATNRQRVLRYSKGQRSPRLSAAEQAEVQAAVERAGYGIPAEGLPVAPTLDMPRESPPHTTYRKRTIHTSLSRGELLDVIATRPRKAQEVKYLNYVLQNYGIFDIDATQVGKVYDWGIYR